MVRLQVGRRGSQRKPIDNKFAGSLHPGSKGVDQTAISSVYQSFWPLEETVGYSDVSLSVPTTTTTSTTIDADAVKIERSTTPGAKNPTSVKLSFKQNLPDNGGAKPDVMHLMYAIGMSPQLGIHASRGCFDVVEFPTCSVGSSSSGGSGTSEVVGETVSLLASKEQNGSEDGAPSSSSTSLSFTTLLAGIVAVSSVLSLA